MNVGTMKENNSQYRFGMEYPDHELEGVGRRKSPGIFYTSKKVLTFTSKYGIM